MLALNRLFGSEFYGGVIKIHVEHLANFGTVEGVHVAVDFNCRSLGGDLDFQVIGNDISELFITKDTLGRISGKISF